MNYNDYANTILGKIQTQEETLKSQNVTSNKSILPISTFSLNEPMLMTVQPEEEAPMTINDRTIIIPEFFKNLCVEHDNSCETVFFEMNRYYDGNDLSIYPCYVDFMNRKGETDTYAVNDLIILEDEETLRFSWKIYGNVTKLPGILKFAVRFEKIIGEDIIYSWHTVPAAVTIMEGIVVDGTILDEYPSALQSLFNKMETLENKVDNSPIGQLEEMKKSIQLLQDDVEDLKGVKTQLINGLDDINGEII